MINLEPTDAATQDQVLDLANLTDEQTAFSIEDLDLFYGDKQAL